ncbi:MAG: hypothetical protein AAFW81_00915 [Pseudomonadota bacterium]
MKTGLLEAAATALLVASEAFIFGFGAVWVALFSLAPGVPWIAPAVVVGLALAAWSALAVFGMAKRAADERIAQETGDVGQD